jgi:glycosyltransferase involved in cell wall biosynthesis
MTQHGASYGLGWRQAVALRLASLLTDHMVCVSQDTLEVSARRGVSRRKLCTILNGIDTEQFTYSGPRPDGPALFVGRLVPVKDVGTLLHAVARITREDPSFRLELAGDGPCLDDLRQLATRLGIDEYVKFLGEVRDIPSLLVKASLFVLPSLSEGISLTLLEAMARGLPVVTTRVGGNVEVVADGDTGLIVSPADPDLLAGAIQQLRRNHDIGNRMGLRGRQRIERFFDIRKTIAEYEKLYTSCFKS